MKKTIRMTLAAMLMLPVMGLVAATALPASEVSAAGNLNGQCGGALSIKEGVDCTKSDDQTESLFDSNDGIFVTITNVLLFIIGAIAVIMLIIGGIRYTISGGDSGQVTSAKNTILYAVVGIIVAILAYAIVNFVVGSLVE